MMTLPGPSWGGLFATALLLSFFQAIPTHVKIQQEVSTRGYELKKSDIMMENTRGCAILLIGGSFLLFLLTGPDGLGHVFVIVVVCFLLYYLYIGNSR